MNEKTKKILDNIVRKILSDDELPGLLRKTIINKPGEIPCTGWSFLNRFAVSMAGTIDARGYNQWHKCNRFVKKGSKAIYILVPLMKKISKDVEKNGVVKTEIFQKITSFKAAAVFRYEDTDGDELEYRSRLESIESAIEKFPLLDIAKTLGVNISPELSSRGENGFFYPGHIGLCSDSETTFFHELSHAIDFKLGSIGKEEKPLDEVVAELSSALLASTYGTSVNLNYTRAYIKSWSNGSHPGIMISRAMNRVDAIYKYVSSHHNEHVSAA